MKNADIAIRIEGGVIMESLDVWPNDDGPDHPSAEDVAKVIKGEGSLVNFLERWKLESHLAVNIRVVKQIGEQTHSDEAHVEWP